MKLTTILLSLTVALSASALHAAPTAKQILETQGEGETSCPDDERGAVTEIKILTSAEASKLTLGQIDPTSKSKYLMLISTLSPAVADLIGESTDWTMQEVDENVKLDDFKPMIGIPSCYSMGH